MDVDRALGRHRERFEEAGLPAEARVSFEDAYRAFAAGEGGKVPWQEVSPPLPGDLLPLGDVEGEASRRRGEAEFGRVVWIVLNGGLGTSMKMDRAKSILPVKGDDTFLDLIARHVRGLRERTGADVPVLFMNSFATREDTLRALAPYELETRGLPLDFLQHRFPRIRADDGMPFGDPAGRESWAPPGHGNLYSALASCGLLDELVDRGITGPSSPTRTTWGPASTRGSWEPSPARAWSSPWR